MAYKCHASSFIHCIACILKIFFMCHMTSEFLYLNIWFLLIIRVLCFFISFFILSSHFLFHCFLLIALCISIFPKGFYICLELFSLYSIHLFISLSNSVGVTNLYFKYVSEVLSYLKYINNFEKAGQNIEFNI